MIITWLLFDHCDHCDHQLISWLLFDHYDHWLITVVISWLLFDHWLIIVDHQLITVWLWISTALMPLQHAYVVFNTIYCKSFEVDKFRGFRGSIGNHEIFSSEIDCAIGLGHARLPSNHECFPANYSLVLQPWNFSTASDLQYMVYRVDNSFWLATILHTNKFTYLGQVFEIQLINCGIWLRWMSTAYVVYLAVM